MSEEETSLFLKGVHPASGSAFVCSPCRAALMAKSIQLVLAADKAGAFHLPIDEDVAPGYLRVVRRPMDLSTIAAGFASGSYVGIWGPQRLRQDVEQVFVNAMVFNEAGDMLWKDAARLLAASAQVFDRWLPWTHVSRDTLKQCSPRINAAVRGKLFSPNYPLSSQGKRSSQPASAAHGLA